jgi:hypothetical protein
MTDLTGSVAARSHILDATILESADVWLLLDACAGKAEGSRSSLRSMNFTPTGISALNA